MGINDRTLQQDIRVIERVDFTRGDKHLYFRCKHYPKNSEVATSAFLSTTLEELIARYKALGIDLLTDKGTSVNKKEVQRC